jgi:hypothetical protein
MGTVSIFALEFSGVKFACSRDFTGGYTLLASDYTVSMTPARAGTLAGGGARIRALAEVAKFYGRGLKPGATFRRDLQAVDGRSVSISLGVTDGGDGLFLEIGSSRMTLTDQQAQLLLATLDQLGRDVSTLYRASERPVPNFGVAPGLRGFPIRIPGGDGDEWI